jgi:hypothetical protein
MWTFYLVFAAPAAAQSSDFKREVFGSIGIGKVYDDEGSLGSGLNGCGGFGYRIVRRFGVEAEISGFRTKREFSPAFPPFRGHGAHVLGNGLIYLNRGRGQAYVILGAGLGRFTTRVNFGGASINDSRTGFAVACGFGVKIFATPHFSLRPEVRVHAADNGPISDLRLSFGAGYHW